MAKLSKLDVGGVHDGWSSSLLPLHKPHPPSIITTVSDGLHRCMLFHVAMETTTLVGTRLHIYVGGSYSHRRIWWAKINAKHLRYAS